MLWRTNAPNCAVEVMGVDAATLKDLADQRLRPRDWQKFFAVTVEQDSIRADLATPPMAGSYTITNSRCVFRPAYPFEAGVAYRAVFRFEAKDGRIISTASRLALSAANREPVTVVAQIYPSADVLPENLLKFYLYFSGPMSRGQIYEHIHLIDEHGKPVELPFLEIQEELWNPEMTRLTLFLDPGRIKRGVRPLEEVGPALAAGHSYTLRIDRDWKDAGGAPLKRAFEKKFRVAPPDREPPDPKRWKATTPKFGSREPLVVTFNEPIDYALGLRMIRVLNAHGSELAGSKSLVEGEQVWKFLPDEPWSAGTVELSVRSTIEDLAGNNIGRPFEVDLAEGPKPAAAPQVVKRVITIGQGGQRLQPP